jgi:spore germination protein KC
MGGSFLRKIANIFFFISFCPYALLLTGCWDRTEVNDLAIITAAGIEKKNDKTIELSVQVFVPRSQGGAQQMSGGGGGGASSVGQTFVRSAQGTTIADAMSNLQEKFSRRIFWGHDEVFIVGQKLAKEGIRSSMDFMMRHPQVREGAYVLISKDDPKQVLRLSPSLERSSSEVLREMAKSKIVLQVTLKDLMQRMQGESEAVGLPWIESLPPGPGRTKNQNDPYLVGTAVFKKDKMVGRIDDRSTRGVLWLRDEIKTAVITVTPKEAKGFISMKLLRANTQLIPKIENGKWTVTVKVDTEDDIIQNGTTLDLNNLNLLKSLEHDLEANVEVRAQQALDQVQKNLHADIFDFARAFNRKYPKVWHQEKDRWDEIFPEVEVNFEVKANIRRPGKSVGPAGVPDKEVKHK